MYSAKKSDSGAGVGCFSEIEFGGEADKEEEARTERIEQKRVEVENLRKQKADKALREEEAQLGKE